MLGDEHVERTRYARLIEWLDHSSGRTNALAHRLATPRAGEKGRRLRLALERIQPPTPLASAPESGAEPRSRKHRDARAFGFEHRIGRDRGALRERCDRVRSNPVRPE